MEVIRVLVESFYGPVLGKYVNFMNELEYYNYEHVEREWDVFKSSQ